MRMVQNARLAAFAAVLTVAAAACGGDSNGPGDFNPTGTSQDLAAVQATFQSEEFGGFVVMSSAMTEALQVPVVAPELAAAFDAATGSPTEMRAKARAVFQTLQARSGAALSSRIPDTYVGKTFEYDVVDDRYEPTERAGAPANGVRFIMYAINPATDEPAEPLNEVGYVDLIDNSTAAVSAARILMVSGGTTYFDYSISATDTDLGITGFLTDGTTRADFTLDIFSDGTSGTLDYEVEVDSRSLVMEFHYDSDATGETLSAHIAGENGTVDLSGSFDEVGGQLDVQVNGEDFATMTYNDETGEFEIVGADGEPLSDQEEQVLGQIMAMFSLSLVIPFVLLGPAAAFIAF